MTVKELIEKLTGLDEDLPVVVYVEVGEDMDDAHDVCIQDRDKPEDWLYCKGDHLFTYDPRVDRAVCIR